ncbi:outer membrane protein/peptidoglycan-associated (lipo)protein [Hoeflea sp. IMCC20628]|uniref:OmpA family protein n=1 Tax=Hoeflea sp. IMCC20628 TaxID=1620421 RepID=UPI00063BDEC8|nr:OmpA family protein [Hoeflea sp. IMCC20628]AKI00985.1 outer membrane protein/peptidoglycan-associated (lipo)protein [Hoeflea sp. IMCC20628]
MTLTRLLLASTAISLVGIGFSHAAPYSQSRVLDAPKSAFSSSVTRVQLSVGDAAAALTAAQTRLAEAEASGGDVAAAQADVAAAQAELGAASAAAEAAPPAPEAEIPVPEAPAASEAAETAPEAAPAEAAPEPAAVAEPAVEEAPAPEPAEEALAPKVEEPAEEPAKEVAPVEAAPEVTPAPAAEAAPEAAVEETAPEVAAPEAEAAPEVQVEVPVEAVPAAPEAPAEAAPAAPEAVTPAPAPTEAAPETEAATEKPVPTPETKPAASEEVPAPDAAPTPAAKPAASEEVPAPDAAPTPKAKPATTEEGPAPEAAPTPAAKPAAPAAETAPAEAAEESKPATQGDGQQTDGAAAPVPETDGAAAPVPEEVLNLPVQDGAPVLDSAKEKPVKGDKPSTAPAASNEPAPPPPASDEEAQAPALRSAPAPEAMSERGERVKERPAREAQTDVTIINQIDNRTLIEVDNRTIIEHDERDRLRAGSEEVYYEQLRGGRVREVIVRPNGVQLVTITNRWGDVVQRSRVMPDGREYVLFFSNANSDGSREAFVDPGRALPPLRLSIPINEYILDSTDAEPSAYLEFLMEPPVEQVERLYTVEEVTRSARLRDKVRRIDLDSLTFEFGKATIAEDQIQRLSDVADAMTDILGNNPAETFLIEGHTDAVGKDEANLVLSDRRAETIAVALSDVFGIPPENMVTQGYGERYLKVSTEAPERLNRRVTIRRITPLVTPVASR